MSSNKQFSLEAGKKVTYQGRHYRIAELSGISEVTLIDELSKKVFQAAIGDLEPAGEQKSAAREDLLEFDEETWLVAKGRLKVIKSLLNKAGRTRQQVAEVAQTHDLHTNTVYGWLKAYEASEMLSSLLPKKRSDKGATKLNDETEEIIKESIASEYLTKQKKSQRKVIDEVRKRCKKQGIEPPHDNTVRNRIKSLAPELVAARRLGRKVADNSFKPIEGKFPGADWPLAVVQIDHTKLDIILVDDHYRRPIGRPWITLAFDVFSRMVTGFYVSFDPPSALTTGLSLVHSILPKEKWLAKHDLDGEWPVWGLPAKIHLDNAKEFRGNMLQKACDEYGIDIEWRPVARPNFGAHVERALGTFSKEIHALPGSTFSNIREKGEYDSEARASLTLSEFETWLANYVVNVYHQKFHSMINMSPLALYRKGILGDEEAPGCGLPSKIVDEDRLRLDLMPYEMRSVLDYGIVIDKIHYYHDVIRPWINAPDLSEPRKKRKFMVRRDPRDISQIWFYDPELHIYYPIPYRDTSHPAISIWELREARKRAEAQGREDINEAAIFDAFERMREIEEQAVTKTKAVRRSVQRRKSNKSVEKPSTPAPDAVITKELNISVDEELIEPFDEMDEWS
ncbi:DDE-type integrase/transposase/recombinase [Thalassomonas viridans]|uniref:DDE-type integrase/transposase/recombinase n=1 Tax=Thalassomonas viridans TaxID=137584 RepID=A0AAE9Z0J9_9GAMM|nr:Mu transposase C-terminal domain-containing protein [Thalassomonas viridans]WDE03875.1 DDE-type integrase/transposase/recombinase [Thalassomonas viridans]